MRVNVYAEEITNRVELVEKEIEGEVFTGIRFYLELPVTQPATIGGKTEHIKGPFIHKPGDDDSAAVTFWGKRDLIRPLEKALVMLYDFYGVSIGDLLHGGDRFKQQTAAPNGAIPELEAIAKGA